jgi:hypothetical protein
MPSEWSELARPSRKVWVVSLMVVLYFSVICTFESQSCVMHNVFLTYLSCNFIDYERTLDRKVFRVAELFLDVFLYSV